MMKKAMITTNTVQKFVLDLTKVIRVYNLKQTVFKLRILKIILIIQQVKTTS